MSVRSSAYQDGFYATANLPTAWTTFTIMAWTRVMSMRSDYGDWRDYSDLWRNFQGTYPTDYFTFTLGLDNVTTPTLYIWSETDGHADDMYVSVTIPGNVMVGVDFAWYIKVSGAGANQVELGARLLTSDSWTTSTGTMPAGVHTPYVSISHGSWNSATWPNARQQNWKMWNRALSASELLAESKRRDVVSSTDLLQAIRADGPDVSTALTDRSGLGTTYTTEGALTINDQIYNTDIATPKVYGISANTGRYLVDHLGRRLTVA